MKDVFLQLSLCLRHPKETPEMSELKATQTKSHIEHTERGELAGAQLQQDITTSYTVLLFR